MPIWGNTSKKRRLKEHLKWVDTQNQLYEVLNTLIHLRELIVVINLNKYLKKALKNELLII